MSRKTWRLLVTYSADGPMNMAIDQAIMEAVAEQRVPPTLRFYAWQPPCLSLGYTQPARETDRARLERFGWGLVRRLTGGRAVLHIDELTYSVALPDHDPIVAGDIVTSYRNLSRALVAGLQTLGAAPRAEKRSQDQTREHGPVCFEVPSHYEITIHEKKLVGSAQVRKFGAVLQHGSLPLYGDIARICDALVFDDENVRSAAKDRVRQRATTLAGALDAEISWEQAVTAMIESFCATFDLDLVESDTLTPDEQNRARFLCETQYGSEDWTSRF